MDINWFRGEKRTIINVEEQGVPIGVNAEIFSAEQLAKLLTSQGRRFYTILHMEHAMAGIWPAYQRYLQKRGLDPSCEEDSRARRLINLAIGRFRRGDLEYLQQLRWFSQDVNGFSPINIEGILKVMKSEEQKFLNITCGNP